MPFYDYHCTLCDHRFERYGSVKSPHPKKCPACGKQKGFYQVLGAVIGVHGGEPTCVGQVAERNTKKLSSEQYEAIMNEGRDTPYKGPLPKGATLGPKKKKGKTPWWRDGSIPGLKKMDEPLDLKKVKDINKYIEHGDMR